MCKHLWYSDTFIVPCRSMVRDWCCSCGERNPMLPLGGWHFTQHALGRALDMAVDPEEIRRVLTQPEVKQATDHPNHPAGSHIWAAGRIALVVRPAEFLVVTVLWRGRVYERGTDSEPFRDN